jgi:hypothetical protein
VLEECKRESKAAAMAAPIKIVPKTEKNIHNRGH